MRVDFELTKPAKKYKIVLIDKAEVFFEVESFINSLFLLRA